jgi:hypothetical protein
MGVAQRRGFENVVMGDLASGLRVGPHRHRGRGALNRS